MKYISAPHGPFLTEPLEDDDLASVQVIYHATFASHNDADFRGSWCHRNRQSSMGLFYKATLIGFGLVNCEDRLAFLAVDAAYRGSGSGSQLLRAILQTLNYCYLVPVNNIKVIEWYQRHGFVQCGAERNYAPDEAHFIMTYIRSPQTISLGPTTFSRECSDISILSI